MAKLKVGDRVILNEGFADNHVPSFSLNALRGTRGDLTVTALASDKEFCVGLSDADGYVKGMFNPARFTVLG